MGVLGHSSGVTGTATGIPIGMGNDRELLDTGNDKRYIRRDDEGKFTDDQVDVGRSLSQDQKQHAKTNSPKGQGDRGDHRD